MLTEPPMHTHFARKIASVLSLAVLLVLSGNVRAGVRPDFSFSDSQPIPIVAADTVYYCDPLDAGSACAQLTDNVIVDGSGDAFDRENIHEGVNFGGPNIRFIQPAANTVTIGVVPQRAFPEIKYTADYSVALISPAIPHSAFDNLDLSPIAVGKHKVDAIEFDNPAVGLARMPLGLYVFPAFQAGVVAFHLVTDVNGNSSSMDAIKIQQIWSALPGEQSATAIWSQVNVSFDRISSVDLSIPPTTFNTAPMEIDDSPDSATRENQSYLFGRVTPGSRYNVYFVHSLKDIVRSSELGGATLAVGATGVFFCNGSGTLAQTAGILIATHHLNGSDIPLSEIADTLAHELGHALGLPPSYRGQPLGIDSDDETLSYRVMSNFDGATITPLQRDCIWSVDLF